jgi:hypothetical protein
VDAIRQKLLEDYSGSVFQDRTGGNPQIQRPHGEAEIILNMVAIPVKQRMFQIQGERRAAWVKLIDEIFRDEKIEPGISPWSSPSFPVPKKNPNDPFTRIIINPREILFPVATTPRSKGAKTRLKVQSRPTRTPSSYQGGTFIR